MPVTPEQISAASNALRARRQEQAEVMRRTGLLEVQLPACDEHLREHALQYGWWAPTLRQQSDLAAQAREHNAFPIFLDALRRIEAGDNDARATARAALGDFL